MKHLAPLVLIILTVLSGCKKTSLGEAEFNAMWNEYQKQEFVESFDGKLSIDQKKKLLSETVQKKGYDIQVFKQYMKTNHASKYRKVFDE